MAKKEKEEEKPSTKEEPEAKAAEQPKCKNCRLRIRNLCHRFPPQGDSGSRVGFPRVKEDDWCGEHQFVEEVASEPEQEQE